MLFRSAGPTSVRHGRDGRRRTGRQKTNSDAPLPGAPNVGFRVPADPLDSNTGVRAEISPSAYLQLTASLWSKQSKEQHKRHRVYTGSGHHCGVIPYSSVWCGGLPLELMMNNTRKNSLARVCSWLVQRTTRGSLVALWIDASTLGWLVLFIGKGPGTLPKY